MKFKKLQFVLYFPAYHTAQTKESGENTSAGANTASLPIPIPNAKEEALST